MPQGFESFWYFWSVALNNPIGESLFILILIILAGIMLTIVLVILMGLLFMVVSRFYQRSVSLKYEYWVEDDG